MSGGQESPVLELLLVLQRDLMFFCPQLWPGILFTKVCLLVEVLMVLCSSGTLGNDAEARRVLCDVYCFQCSHLCFSGWRRKLEGWRWLMKG